MWTHYTLLRNARSKQRSAHLRLATQVRAQILPHAEGALRRFSKPREARADQERLRRPSGGVRHVAGGWGKSTPSHQPGALGSFLGVKAKPLRGRGKPRALTPIPPTVPLKPLRGPLARFRVKGGSRGWCGPQPRRGEDRPLDATGATQACRQGVGALFPGTPAPRRRPRQGRRKALIEHAVQGAPPAGVPRGAQPLGPCAANKNPLPKASISCSSSFAFGSSSGPKRGLIYRYRRGRGES